MTLMPAALRNRQSSAPWSLTLPATLPPARSAAVNTLEAAS